MNTAEACSAERAKRGGTGKGEKDEDYAQRSAVGRGTQLRRGGDSSGCLPTPRPRTPASAHQTQTRPRTPRPRLFALSLRVSADPSAAEREREKSKKGKH